MDDQTWMERAIEQAHRAWALGEVPVGAVLVDQAGQVIAEGFNQCIHQHDTTAHAEIHALREAGQRVKNYRFPGATLYVTLEPCAMCLSALLQARVARIVFGAYEPKTGACGSVINLATNSQLNHQTQVEGGILAETCGNILKEFFRERRLQQRTSQIMHAEHPIERSLYLISPCGAIPDASRLPIAVENLTKMGFKVDVDPAATHTHMRFAGTDEERLAGIMRAVKQPNKIVLATRGGYGMTRLLHRMDWKAIEKGAKLFAGYSDMTALNLALLAKLNMPSLTGPMAVSDFGKQRYDKLTASLFNEMINQELEILSFETDTADGVDCRGVLWGGNLSLVHALIGTPFFPQVNGILVLEDVAESPYRVERMLITLLQAGVLDKQKAILLGNFSDYKLESNDQGFDMPEVIAWLRTQTKTPIITGLPYGHTKLKATLPIGVEIGVATEDGTAHLVFDRPISI